MERWVRLCPIWHTSIFWFLPLIILSFFLAAKSEITCRSCPPGDKGRIKELLLKTDTREFATGHGGEVIRNGYGATASRSLNSASAETQQLDCAAGSDERIQGKYIYSRRKRNTDMLLRSKNALLDGGMHYGGGKQRKFTPRGEYKVSNLKMNRHAGNTGKARADLIPCISHKHRVRRNSPTANIGDDKVKSSGSPQRMETLPLSYSRVGITSPAGRSRVTRSELRWSNEDRRAASSRQDELKLTSSTFALTGDSAHNQAMVHWSGQNSSVSEYLYSCFKIIFGLCASTDYGTTYQKLNEKVGAKTILTYLYVSPNNKRKIMLLTDPEVESSLLISSDEGATYQKYRLSFYILSLLFHPEQEDWILAYSHDQKVRGEGGEIYMQLNDLHVISTDENRVVAAVQEWNQNDTYNLYVSETGGVFYTLALENVVSSMGHEGNVMIDLYEVNIQPMLWNTYTTYSCGTVYRPRPIVGFEVWRPCGPYCSLHLHLHVSANPYTSGNIESKDSAPGIIVASGSLYFIPFAFQIFDEEYSVLYLDQGGALVAIRHTPLPIRHLWMSFDEGRHWNKYSFTMSPLFVDGLLGEPGEETLIMTIFGHVSHRSEWQLVKIDFRSIFNRRCTEGDYQTWHLHNRGEPCIMGVKRIYRKLKPIARCVMGKTYSVTMTSAPCDCTEADFECDYGYERRSDGKCTPAFWFLPSSMSRSCTTGTTFINSTGYRKVVSNNCTAGVIAEYTAKRQHCPTQAPKGLHLVTSEGKLTATLGTNVTFLVFLEEGDVARTSIMVDFGDGHALTYSNVSSIEDGVKHVYKAVGIYRVTATGENSLGSESVVLYLHVTCQLEYIHLSAPFVAVKSKEVNLTAVLWPSQVGTVTYIWWFGNNTEPIITLEGSVACTFSREGVNTVTVQVSAGNAILQDRKTIAVHEYFRSHLLAFSSNLDDHNPDVAEWRLDVSRVIKNSMVKLSEILLSALNQNLVQFTLRPGVQVTVYAAHLSAAPLVDTGENHSGSAMLMLLSVVVLGLAIFVVYKFKRKIPGLNVYAQMQNEKEQEMIPSPVSPTESTLVSPNTPRELVTSPELMDTELNTRPIGE
uniref:Sortilin related VPS10 domain containing receptor 1 n=1 Tax=Hucho hucho TaxID=62062 RepID=A0A4W5RMB6_9TELE